MQSDETIVANVALSNHHASRLTFHDLETWVIWQFPRKKDSGLVGAVRPSLPEHGWYPAIIYPKEKRVQVYGHLNTLYNSPEEASESIT